MSSPPGLLPSNDFRSLYRHGFLRVAATTLRTSIADPPGNAESVLRVARECHDDLVGLVVFPELTLTGYSIEDILMQDTLLDSVETALLDVVAGSADLLPVLVVGAPLRYRHRIYNCAVVVHRGRVLGVAPKSYLPTYREFYERRQIAPGDEVRTVITVGGQTVPFGPDLLFAAEDVPGFVLHVEVCEDMWVPVPPSAEAALAGATVLANLSGSPITVGRAEDRCLLCRSASSRCLAAYVYAAAGEGESSTDLAWDGQTMIWENGVGLAQSERFPKGEQRSVADIDLDLLRAERLRMGTFDDNRRHQPRAPTSSARCRSGCTRRTGTSGSFAAVERFPFVPSDETRLELDCYEAYNIQVSGLEQRLRAIGRPKLVIGVSGGPRLHAGADRRGARDGSGGRSRSDILAFTLPGFATGERTKANAMRLMRALGVTWEELDITDTARLMLTELGHPFSRGEPVYDVTFENVQAGLRTDYLFRAANQRDGIVLGTGDLSELALGWCTYGVGDQMSHYNVNGGVPKTLIQHLIRWVVVLEAVRRRGGSGSTDVLDTEITPELVPTGEDEQVQSSEAKVGPYCAAGLHPLPRPALRLRPSKIAFLAWHAWRDPESGEWPPGFPADERFGYTLAEIRHWLEVFLQRFFAFSQFKRSALPNGPKVSAGGSLSPRGDWRAPSDMSARIWLDDVRSIPEDGMPGAASGSGAVDARVLAGERHEHSDGAPAPARRRDPAAAGGAGRGAGDGRRADDRGGRVADRRHDCKRARAGGAGQRVVPGFVGGVLVGGQARGPRRAARAGGQRRGRGGDGAAGSGPAAGRHLRRGHRRRRPVRPGRPGAGHRVPGRRRVDRDEVVRLDLSGEPEVICAGATLAALDALVAALDR